MPSMTHREIEAFVIDQNVYNHYSSAAACTHVWEKILDVRTGSHFSEVRGSINRNATNPLESTL